MRMPWDRKRIKETQMESLPIHPQDMHELKPLIEYEVKKRTYENLVRMRINDIMHEYWHMVAPDDWQEELKEKLKKEKINVCANSIPATPVKEIQ